MSVIIGDQIVYKISDNQHHISNKQLIKHFLHTKHAHSDDAFFIIDVGMLTQLYRMWDKVLPGITPHYAVKCNSDPVLLSVLSSLGCGFDCASKQELASVLNMPGKMEASRIIYANPCKQVSHIKYAKLNNINLATFDNASELHKYAMYHEHSELVIRIAVNDKASLSQLSDKFGCALDEVDGLIQLCRELDLKLVGVAFHVGSCCSDPELYRLAIQDARTVFDIALTYHYKLSLLDIGGGFPSCPGEDYNSANVKLFLAMAGTINASINYYFSDWELRIIAEPGRYFAGSTHILAVNITSIRINNNSNRIMYYVNEGLYGAFNCIVFDHQQKYPILLDEYNPYDHMYNSSIWGPTCDSIDKLLDSIQLPLLQVGDWLYYEDMGAYTKSARSDFNGFPAPINYYYMLDNDATPANTTSSAIINKLSLPIYSSNNSNNNSIDYPVVLVDRCVTTIDTV